LLPCNGLNRFEEEMVRSPGFEPGPDPFYGSEG
jgi:hypothetical protein